jgi:glycerophosphoryl diester phosphodiesterase
MDRETSSHSSQSTTRTASSPCLIANRGNTADYPENTLPALRSALDLGVQYLKIDVQLAADYTPILLRPNRLRQADNMETSVFNLTAEELAKIRIKVQSRFGQRAVDVGIPTLAQTSLLLTAYPTSVTFVDIQQESLQRFGYQTTLDAITRSARNVIDRIILVSSDLPAIEFARRTRSVMTAWTLPNYSRVTALKCEAIAPDYLFCDYALLPKESSRLWRGPWRWVIANVETLEQAKLLCQRGVNFILTSDARRLARELRQQNVSS